MRGKKPKERQRYVLRVNETLVEVTRDVYLAWYQSRRKERYQLDEEQHAESFSFHTAQFLMIQS